LRRDWRQADRGADLALPVSVERQQDRAVTEPLQTGARIPITDLVSGKKSAGLSDVQVSA